MYTMQHTSDTDPNMLFEELYALLEEEKVQKALKKAIRKAANTPRPFVSFPELAFPSDWCPPAIENRLSYVTPGSADDEVFTAMSFCDHLIAFYPYKGVITNVYVSNHKQYDARHRHQTVQNRFCPLCGKELYAVAD